MTRSRLVLARLVWLVCVLCALVLAGAALLVALDVDPSAPAARALLDVARVVDLGVFTPVDGLHEFGGPDAVTRDALFNWGVGAIAWLVLGAVLERVLRPRRSTHVAGVEDAASVR